MLNVYDSDIRLTSKHTQLYVKLLSSRGINFWDKILRRWTKLRPTTSEPGDCVHVLRNDKGNTIASVPVKLVRAVIGE